MPPIPTSPTAPPSSRRNGLIQKLETLKVEIFPGNKTQENKERKAPLPTDEGAEPEKPKK